MKYQDYKNLKFELQIAAWSFSDDINIDEDNGWLELGKNVDGKIITGRDCENVILKEDRKNKILNIERHKN